MISHVLVAILGRGLQQGGMALISDLCVHCGHWSGKKNCEPLDLANQVGLHLKVMKALDVLAEDAPCGHLE